LATVIVVDLGRPDLTIVKVNRTGETVRFPPPASAADLERTDNPIVASRVVIDIGRLKYNVLGAETLRGVSFDRLLTGLHRPANRNPAEPLISVIRAIAWISAAIPLDVESVPL
jgi:hypothetical protein